LVLLNPSLFSLSMMDWHVNPDAMTTFVKNGLSIVWYHMVDNHKPLSVDMNASLSSMFEGKNNEVNMAKFRNNLGISYVKSLGFPDKEEGIKGTALPVCGWVLVLMDMAKEFKEAGAALDKFVKFPDAEARGATEAEKDVWRASMLAYSQQAVHVHEQLNHLAGYLRFLQMTQAPSEDIQAAVAAALHEAGAIASEGPKGADNQFWRFSFDRTAARGAQAGVYRPTQLDDLLDKWGSKPKQETVAVFLASAGKVLVPKGRSESSDENSSTGSNAEDREKKAGRRQPRSSVPGWQDKSQSECLQYLADHNKLEDYIFDCCMSCIRSNEKCKAGGPAKCDRWHICYNCVRAGEQVSKCVHPVFSASCPHKSVPEAKKRKVGDRD